MAEPKQDDGTAIRVLLLTWNVGNCSESVLDERILLRDEDFKNLEVAPKLVFIGFQEVDASMHNNFSLRWGYSAWSLRLMEQLSTRGFIMIHHETFPGLLAILFVSYDWLPHVNLVEADSTKLMFESLVGSKGAIGIRALVGSETFCFVNSHLPAHLADHKERDKAYLTILADQYYSKCDSTVLNHDFVFWIGDLNFRIDEIPNLEVKHMVLEGKFDELLKQDQLKFSMASGRSFSPFQEGDITFAPSYKYNVGTQEFDSSEKKRKPAWCDRILWRDKPKFRIHGHDPGVSCLKYTSIRDCCASDHKPVYGVYQVRLENFKFEDPLVVLEMPEGNWLEDAGDNIGGEISMVPVKKGASVKFRMRQSQGFLEKIDSWDWVGVYADNAIKLKDYLTYKYVSTSDWTKARIKFDPKDFKNSQNGKYRLIYHSSKLKSAVGVSCLFKTVK
ncbi:inositol polyphosphate 5-phosphatase K-like isoform X2 [Convolutriloba macropyga]|uniref:inositol polyphosphate 5-phosphatase K-like isoform X2 n=1 Tax=Convolutriloba macropyga TaxID=536237 RepID=UPI003F51B726